MSPFAGLAHSRKFWLAMVDVLISTVLYFVGKYAGAAVEDLKFMIGAYQPVIIMVIIGITGEDMANAKADAAVTVAHVEASVAPKAPVAG